VQIAYDEVCPDAVLIAEHPAEAALATSFSGIPENSVPAEPLKTMQYINFFVSITVEPGNKFINGFAL
jgi:hypothetical protein